MSLYFYRCALSWEGAHFWAGNDNRLIDTLDLCTTPVEQSALAQNVNTQTRRDITLIKIERFARVPRHVSTLHPSLI